MRETCRYWIRLLVVAAIFIGSGLGGALAHPAAGGHAGTGHEHGRVLDETQSLTAAGSLGHNCHGGLLAGTHCGQVHCCPSALQWAESRLDLPSPVRDKFVEMGASLHHGQLFYPLLRPPIAIA